MSLRRLARRQVNADSLRTYVLKPRQLKSFARDLVQAFCQEGPEPPEAPQEIQFLKVLFL